MEYQVIFCAFGIVAGLVGLWWSSDKAVEYALKLSKIFGITTFFVGFFFMAIATGLPELAITISSLWSGVPQVALGNILGSNFVDISLVLGLPAVLFGTLNVKKEEKLPLMLMLLTTSLVMAFVFIVRSLYWIHGIVLLVLYIVLLWWLWKTKAIGVVSEEKAIEELSGEKAKKKTWVIKLILGLKCFVSLLLVLFFSKLSIDCTIVVTKVFTLAVEAIGATIFALGTSFPELALSIQAVKKKEYSLAFGNAFGSVLEQATLILGILIIGSDKPLKMVSLRPIAPLMLLGYGVVAHALLKKTKVGRQEGLGRIEGSILLVLCIISFIYFIFFA